MSERGQICPLCVSGPLHSDTRCGILESTGKFLELSFSTFLSPVDVSFRTIYYLH